MQLTTEQKAIVATRGNLKINAVAGSGKTSTLLAYAQAQPLTAKGLYLAFNKTVKTEARARFNAAGLSRMRVETAHSLAYGYVVRDAAYQVRASAYRPYEIAQLLHLEQIPEALAITAPGQGRAFSFVLAAHIAKVLAQFCNSGEMTVKAINYASTVGEPRAHEFAKNYEVLIEHQTRRILQLLDEGSIDITHDFYLKKFQLDCPRPKFDFILFDEAQDASGSMLDWVLKQSGTKVIVGDTHQQIYAWRGAVNSLEQVDYPSLPLSTSFRFGPDLATLATSVLGFKARGGTAGLAQRIPLIGAGKSTARTTKAIIGRSNLGLLVKAISYITGPHAVDRIYFEGSLSAYIYGTEGASMYDVLSLHNNQQARVRDPLLATMGSLSQLGDYATQTGDHELLMLIELVETYGNKLLDVIADLKRRQVSDQARATAQLFFSTVHRCKGLEYDQVELAPDFITAEEVIRWHQREFEPTPPTAAETIMFQEQINLLYVACTRSKCWLWLPLASLPLSYQLPVVAPKAVAAIVGYPGKGTTYLTQPGVVPPGKGRGSATAKDRPAPAKLPLPPRQGAKWTAEEERQLTLAFCRDVAVPQIAIRLGRGVSEVQIRIRALDLAGRYGL